MKLRILIVAFIGLGIVSVLLIRGCETPPSKGKELYEKHCGNNCHGLDGKSILPQMIPPLNHSDFLDKHPESIACIIYYGLEGEITVNGKKYKQPMPGNSKLNEIDIANISNYVYKTFSKKQSSFRSIDIERQLEKCE